MSFAGRWNMTTFVIRFLLVTLICGIALGDEQGAGAVTVTQRGDIRIEWTGGRRTKPCAS